MLKISKKIYDLSKKNVVIYGLALKAYSIYRSIKLNLNISKQSIKILHIGQVNSPHFKELNRKIKGYFKEDGIYQKGYLIGTYPHPTGEYLKGDRVYDWCNYYFSYRKSIFQHQKGILLHGNLLPKKVLNKIKSIINTWRPDIIWVHDLQSGGYNLSEIMYVNKVKSVVVATTYGNDLFYYSDVPCHRSKIMHLLSKIDYLHLETLRDKLIANDLGYKGNYTEIASATFRNFTPCKEIIDYKKDIDYLIKGSTYLRSNFRSIYEIISENNHFFYNKKIVIFNANEEDIFYAEKLKYSHRINIQWFRQIEHKKLADLFKISKFHLTITYSDGMSNTCMESISNRCIPLITKYNGFIEQMDDIHLKINVLPQPLRINDLINAEEFYSKIENIEQFFYIMNNKLLKYYSNEKYLSIFKQIKTIQ